MDQPTLDPDGQSLYRAALRLLSPFEKDKLICMLLHGNMTFTDVNWDALATTLGSKDGRTMYLQIDKIMKKIEDGAVTLPEGDGLRTAYKAKRKRPKKTAEDSAAEGAAPESSLRAGNVGNASVGKGDAASNDAEAKIKRVKPSRGNVAAKAQNRLGETVSKGKKEQSDGAKDGRANGTKDNGLTSTKANETGTARSTNVVTIDP